MKTLDVYLHMRGQRQVIGQLLEEDRRITFGYAPSFLTSGIQLSPFQLPLRAKVFFDKQMTFGGLHGLFNDSLPDGWGLLLLDRKLQVVGKSLDEITPLDRLMLAGANCMGALEYTSPSMTKKNVQKRNSQTILDLDVVASDCMRILLDDDTLSSEQIEKLIAMNGSSGGARPKILADILPDGTVCYNPSEDGAWLIKFKAATDPDDVGLQEYRYSVMAHRAGVDVPASRLLTSKTCPGYFAVKRFDRTDDRQKIHTHTACGLMHASHRIPSMDYEGLFALTIMLTKNMEDVLKLFRLMVFNVLAENQDDHTKNFSFFLDEKNAWRLAPAYDLTHSKGVMPEHMSTVHGKGRNITDDDMLAVGDAAHLKKTTMREIIDRTRTVLADGARDVP